MVKKYWLQYHKYDELGYFPDNFIIHTGKSYSQNALGDVVLLIVGGAEIRESAEEIDLELPAKNNRSKIYILWEKFVIKRVEYLQECEQYEITGDRGVVFRPPILLDSPEFEKFRKQYMTCGFTNITNSSYLPTLLELSGEKLSSVNVQYHQPSQNRLKTKVLVPENIYKNLEAIKGHKAIQMTDRFAVIQHARKIGLVTVAKWIEVNPRNYLMGIVNGFEPNDRECKEDIGYQSK